VYSLHEANVLYYPVLCRQCRWWQRWEEALERARLPYVETVVISTTHGVVEPVNSQAFDLGATEVARKRPHAS
jgi:hypothetical protein